VDCFSAVVFFFFCKKYLPFSIVDFANPFAGLIKLLDVTGLPWLSESIYDYGVPMKINARSFLLCLLTVTPLAVSAKGSEGFYAVQELFEGIATFNYEKISRNVSQDFQLLEVGEV
jgi:hypothetical protein